MISSDFGCGLALGHKYPSSAFGCSFGTNIDASFSLCGINIRHWFPSCNNFSIIFKTFNFKYYFNSPFCLRGGQCYDVRHIEIYNIATTCFCMFVLCLYLCMLYFYFHWYSSSTSRHYLYLRMYSFSTSELSVPLLLFVVV